MALGADRGGRAGLGDAVRLSACVREPIHRLGGVQSYGALVALLDGAVVAASDNAEALLGGPVDGLLSAAALVDDPTARVVPPAPAGEPLDLSLSVLRTVSPFHLEYLRNIGVRSSMPVSLLADGRLWGLIACHSRDVTTLSPQLRAACEFFGVALSLHLAALRERDETAARERSRTVIARLMESIAADLPSGWASGPSGLTKVVECDAVAVRVAGRVVVHGDDPGPAALDELWARLPGDGLWHSDQLGGERPAGALLLSLGESGDGIAWLRRERTTARRWAADPRTPVILGPHGRRLTPRGSTAVFLASVSRRRRPSPFPSRSVRPVCAADCLPTSKRRDRSGGVPLRPSSLPLPAPAHYPPCDGRSPAPAARRRAACLRSALHRTI